MRGRMMLRILAALSLTLLLYNALVVQFWVRPQSSSSLLPRPNARFASTSHSIVYPSPILTSESSSFIMNLPPPLAAVTASPAATSLQIGAHLAGHTDPPSNDASCNHVRNPSFENRCCGDTQFPGWSEGIIMSWPRFFVDCAVKRSGDCSLRLQPGWAVQHVDVNQRSIGPITLMMYLKAATLEPRPHVYMDIEFADGRFLFDQTLPLPSGNYDWTAAGCVLLYPTPVRSISLSVGILDYKTGSLHIDDVSVTEQHSSQPGLPVLHASDSFQDCAADRAAAAAWMTRKDFQAPPPLPHSSCMQVLPGAIKLGTQGTVGADAGTDVTLALQLSIDRLENIRTLLSVWDGCISAVVLVRSWSSDTSALLSFRDRIATDSAFTAQRRSLTFHLAVTTDAAYPVNSLRNIALDQVSTSHVFLVDADFITSVGARAALVERLRHIQGQRKVLVVPAFDVAGGGKDVPRDKSHLQNSGAVAVQLAKSECAHKATQYKRWWSASDPFVITAAEWDKEDFCYEPYFVAPAGIAKFDQRFAAYGGDKAAQTFAIRADGFEFEVQPTVFVVHVEHEHAKWRSDYNWTRAWLNIMFFRASMDSLHGTASTSLANWPRSDCHVRSQPSSSAADTAVVSVGTPPPRANHVVPQYGVKFEPFVLRSDNKILVQDGSSRDSSSTMLKDHHGEKFGANYSVMISKLSAGYEVALGVHISPDKIPNVIQIAKLWAGPVICAILSEHNGAIVEQFKSQVPNVDPVFVPPGSGSDHLYPVNRLRQAALDRCPEHWIFFAIDVDFVPSATLYASLAANSDWLTSVAPSGVVVVPSFEADENQNPPATKAQLDECISAQRCRGVLEKTYSYAHRATNLKHWNTATQPYEIQYEWTYEPYILGLRACLPPYPQEFQYYGNDKISWVYHVAVWGARFHVLPHEFVTHKWHAANKWAGQQRQEVKQKMLDAFNKFKEDIKYDKPPEGCFRAKQNEVW